MSKVEEIIIPNVKSYCKVTIMQMCDFRKRKKHAKNTSKTCLGQIVLKQQDINMPKKKKKGPHPCIKINYYRPNIKCKL